MKIPLGVISVVGLGKLGAPLAALLAVKGYRVIGVDSNPYRANLAENLGAEAVVDPGSPNALQQILDLTGGPTLDLSDEFTTDAAVKVRGLIALALQSAEAQAF